MTMSNSGFIDLRSDTVTVPGPEMRAAMMSADVGDDVYGEDPTVVELENLVAELSGKAAGLFVPSGTMGNQIAINLHCRPGDSVLTEDESHCFLYEAGAAAAMSGVQFELIPLECQWDLSVANSRVRADSIHSATTSLIIIENSHNRCAGRVLPMDKISEVAKWANSRNIAMHCDGARIWNAAVALGMSEKTLLAEFASASLCLSKGLGAPVGSVLVGSSDFIARARKVRKRWGGGMRQVGILAAAGIYALKHHRKTLAEDHQKAEVFFNTLQEAGDPRLQLRFPRPNTNMVYFRHSQRRGDELAEEFRANGVLLNHLGNDWLRAVTHRDVSMAATERAALQILRALELH